MLVLALQFSRAVRDQWAPGALAVIAGAACAVPATSSSALPHTRVAPSKRNSDVRRSGFRWCLIACKQGEGSEGIRMPTNQ